MVELRRGEQLILGQVGVGRGGVQLLLQVLFQRRFQFGGFHTAEGHQRAPSFPVKLIRGSTSAMSRSPNKSPSTDTAE